MSFLFEELAKELGLSKPRIRKYRKLAEDSNNARTEGVLDGKINQYDKAEELITFYTFAPIWLRQDKNGVVEEILKLAKIHESVESLDKISFEKLYRPPSTFLDWLRKEVENHPVRYVREKGRKHVAKGKPLEGNTHVDAVLETRKLLILVEVKFTSDIAYQIDYYPVRNQLSRNIDVGIEVAKKKGKKLIVLLCTPAELYHKKSRLYYYKIQEYCEISKISEDLEWRPKEEIKESLLKVTWIPLEKVIEIVYQNLNSPEVDQAREFFAERKLQTYSTS